MLLPSSLDCAPRKHPRTASYIPATTMLSPSSATCQSPNSSNMYSTCRALQTLLTSNLPTLTPSPKTIRAPPHLGSPIALTSAPRAPQPMKKTKPHAAQPARATISHPSRTPLRSNLKRRRSSIDDQRTPSPDQENLQHGPPRADQETLQRPGPSTPKRQRTYPPTLPLGLNRSDFAALPSTTTPPHTPSPKPSSSSSRDPENQTQDNQSETRDTNTNTTTDSPPWSTPDDSALVALILQKLRLQQSDWDECARRLGKGKDSIGKRWRFLLGDGGVGLRRGRGERRRGGVGGVDFGPVLEGVGGS